MKGTSSSHASIKEDDGGFLSLIETENGGVPKPDHRGSTQIRCLSQRIFMFITEDDQMLHSLLFPGSLPPNPQAWHVFLLGAKRYILGRS